MTGLRDFSNDHSALALNTATLGHNLDGFGQGWEIERVIDACASRDLAGITFWRREIGNRAHQIGERVRSTGMSVTGLCRSPFLVGPLAPPSAPEVLDEFQQAIDMAHGLGTSVLTIVVGGVIEGSHSLTQSLKAVAGIIADAAPYAAKAGVNLALEPLHPVYGGNRSCLVSVRDAIDLCDTINAPNLGIALDVYHIWFDLSLEAELKRAGPNRILSYHLCDWLADTKDVFLDRGMMGDGVADLKAIRRSIENAGYGGSCEVEIFSQKDWWQRDPDDVLDIMVQRFREFC